jgi:glutathione S-transferase
LQEFKLLEVLSMLRLYDYLPSGNGYKVRLLLTQLGIPFERVELDILKGETRTQPRHIPITQG